MVPVLPVTRMVIVQLHVANPRRWRMMWGAGTVCKREWTATERATGNADGPERFVSKGRELSSYMANVCQ